MSLWQRFLNIFRSKANKVLDKHEDPREMLDYSYQRQLELLTKVRRGVADVATSRKRMEMQVGQLETQAAKLAGAGREVAGDGPRGPGPRGADPQVRAQRADRLGAGAGRAAPGRGGEAHDGPVAAQAQVEALRTRKETIKATYTAAEAQTRINEAVSGLGDEMGDVGAAIQRAEDKTAQMQARASAIDELIASGALDDATSLNRGDDITRELEAMSSQAEVEAELARLKSGTDELPPVDAPEAIEAAPKPARSSPSSRSPSRGRT